VGEVDDLLPGDAREEVLVAARDADDLVREHRADDQGDVVLDDGTVELDPGRHLEQVAGQLVDPLRGDGAQVDEGLGVPPLVVDHGHARVGGLEAAVLVAEVLGDRLLRHLGVGAEGDEGGELADPAVQRLVHDRQQLGQGARPGAVRDHQAHALAVEVGGRELLEDERAGLVESQGDVGATDEGGLGGEFGDDVALGVRHDLTLRRSGASPSIAGQHTATGDRPPADRPSYRYVPT